MEREQIKKVLESLLSEDNDKQVDVRVSNDVNLVVSYGQLASGRIVVKEIKSYLKDDENINKTKELLEIAIQIAEDKNKQHNFK